MGEGEEGQHEYVGGGGGGGERWSGFSTISVCVTSVETVNVETVNVETVSTVSWQAERVKRGSIC